MLYVEGITTLDDMAITAADNELIENWATGLGKDIQQRYDRCNYSCFDLHVVSGICKGYREAD
ncbi:hypothetical protein E4U59_004080 [Claviceps monticola]|nr:hypothetical protein E4U59_004080 [Claviceps monticola]